MTDLDPNSAAVRLQAAHDNVTPSHIVMFQSRRSAAIADIWQRVAAEHERICQERAAALGEVSRG